jgi:hypothetical protein
MPFNGSGGVTQPANSIYPATGNTLIESAKANASFADIYTMFPNVICKDGQTTVTANIPFAGFFLTNAGLRAPNGSVGTPSISFQNESDCGFYYIGADNIGFSLAGAKVLDLATTGIAVTGNLSATGNLTVDGNVILGSSNTDTITANTNITITGGTRTTSAPVVTATQTWNDAAVTFTGIFLNITSTASAAASKLVDLQVGASSVFTLDKAGVLTLSRGSAASDTLLLSSTTTGTGILIGGDTNLYRSAANTLKTDDNFVVGTGASLTVLSSATIGGTSAPNVSRLIVNATGNIVGIGAKTDVAAFQVIDCWNATTAGDSVFINFATEASPSNRGSIDFNRGGTAVRYNTTSDARLKIKNGPARYDPQWLPEVASAIFDLTWKETKYRVDTFVAQDLYRVEPDAVKKGDDAAELGPKSEIWGVDPSKLVAKLILEVMALRKRVEELEAA